MDEACLNRDLVLLRQNQNKNPNLQRFTITCGIFTLIPMKIVIEILKKALYYSEANL